MRKNAWFIGLLMAVVMLFGVVGSAVAAVCPEIDNLRASGKMSDEFVSSVHVDLMGVPAGSVSAYVYQGAAETLTTSTFTVLPQDRLTAKGKLHTFFFVLGGQYAPDTIMGVDGSAQDQSITGYVYGPRKSQAITAFVDGIPECLGNPPITNAPSGGGGGYTPSKEATDQPKDDWVTKYYPKAMFSIESTTYTRTVGETTETIEMDVSPYIKNDRTYVPVRYLAYSLGVPEEGVTWNQETQQVGITKDETDIALTIGSSIMTVNSEPLIMDVAPELVNGRTMLPARWVAEALGATVEWDESLNHAIIIVPVTEPGD